MCMCNMYITLWNQQKNWRKRKIRILKLIIQPVSLVLQEPYRKKNKNFKLLNENNIITFEIKYKKNSHFLKKKKLLILKLYIIVIYQLKYFNGIIKIYIIFS